MSILNSVLFASEGRYKVLGVPITFIKMDNKCSNFALSRFDQFFSVVNGHHNMTLVHELGHAFAGKYLKTRRKISICIFINRGGYTRSFRIRKTVHPELYKDVLLPFAGPLTELLFTFIKLSTFNKFKTKIPIVFLRFLCFRELALINGQSRYLFSSNRNSDFEKIRSIDKTYHFMVKILMTAGLYKGYKMIWSLSPLST